MAQNIFDFGQFNNMSRMQSPTSQKTSVPATLNFGAPMSGATNFQTDIAQKVIVPGQQPTPSLKIPGIAQANASDGQQKIQQPQQQKPRGATNLFVNEREALNKMLDDGINEDDALNAITEKRKEIWGMTPLTQNESNALITMAKADIDINEAIKAVKEKRYDDMNILGKIGKNILDMGVAGPALVSEQFANIGSFITGGDELKQEAEDIKRWREENIKNTIGGKAGTYITGAGETIATGPTKLAPTLLGRTAQGAMVGGLTGGAMPILEKGKDATTGDILTSGVIGGVIGGASTPILEKAVIPAVSGTVQKVGKYGKALYEGGVEGLQKSVTRDVSKVGKSIKAPFSETLTRTVPTKIVERDLGFTPKERETINKITGKTPAQYLLGKNLAGKSKEELADVFSKQANEMYNGIGEKLKTLNVTVKSDVADNALNDILEQLTSKPKLARGYANDITAIQKMLEKGEYSLDDLNNIRRAYDKVNNGIYTAKGEIRSGAEAKIDAEIRTGLNEQLQKEAIKHGIDVKAMNTELRAGIEMKDALLRRLSQEQRNDFIGLQDLGVSAILSGGEPVSAIATMTAKKYGEKIAPGVSQKLYNLNKANETSRMTRGNPIINSNKSSKLGLANSNGDNIPSPILSKKGLSLNIKPNETPLGVPKKINETGREVLKPKTLKEKLQNSPTFQKLGDKIDEYAEKTGARKSLLPVKESKVLKNNTQIYNGIEYPKEIYHGTSKEIIGDFKSGVFSANKDYAETYKSSSASSIPKGKWFYETKNNPGLYKTEFDPKKAFDIRNPESKKIYEKYLETDSVSGPGYGVSDKGVIDWTEGENLKMFLDENYPGKYTWLVLDEGGTIGQGGKTFDRGLSYDPINPKNIKLNKIYEQAKKN